LCKIFGPPCISLINVFIVTANHYCYKNIFFFQFTKTVIEFWVRTLNRQHFKYAIKLGICTRLARRLLPRCDTNTHTHTHTQLVKKTLASQPQLDAREHIIGTLVSTTRAFTTQLLGYGGDFTVAVRLVLECPHLRSDRHFSDIFSQLC